MKKINLMDVGGLAMTMTAVGVYLHSYFFRGGAWPPSWTWMLAFGGWVLMIFERYSEMLEMYRPHAIAVCYTDEFGKVWILEVLATSSKRFLAPDTPEGRFLRRATPAEEFDPEIHGVRNYQILDGGRGIRYLGHEYMFQ
jgi:hypothetical protein